MKHIGAIRQGAAVGLERHLIAAPRDPLRLHQPINVFQGFSVVGRVEQRFEFDKICSSAFTHGL